MRSRSFICSPFHRGPNSRTSFHGGAENVPTIIHCYLDGWVAHYAVTSGSLDCDWPRLSEATNVSDCDRPVEVVAGIGSRRHSASRCCWWKSDGYRCSNIHRDASCTFRQRVETTCVDRQVAEDRYGYWTNRRAEIDVAELAKGS